jgi:hypothetical protein
MITQEQILQEADAIGLIHNTSQRGAFIHGMKRTLELLQPKWIEIKSEDDLPPISEEVLFFNKEWINEDFNPRGIRVGFRTDEDFISAHWWDYQDTYMNISHSDCDNNDEFSQEIRDNIEPTHWKSLGQSPHQTTTT